VPLYLEVLALGITTGTPMLGRFGSLVLAVALTPYAALAQPTFTKAFSPSTIGPGSSSTLTFTIDNTTSGAAVTALAFSDDFPSGLILASPALATTTCTGGGGRDASPVVTATGGGGTLTFSGGAVGGGGTCEVEVAVTAASPGSYPNESGALTSSAGSSGTASATLTVSTDRPGFSAVRPPRRCGRWAAQPCTRPTQRRTYGSATTPHRS